MAYTYEELLKMGAQPSEEISSGGFTYEQLIQMGASEYVEPKAFKYETQPIQITPEQRQSRLVQAQQEADQYAKEAKKARSVGGLLKNTIKGVGRTLASSEVGLGETIGKIKSAKFLDTYVNNINNLTNTQIQLQKQIREKELQGVNSENLKRAFNDIQDQIEQNKAEITKYGGELPSTGKVLGQLGGTALDVLTAGTYGKAAQGLKTGALSKTSLPLAKKVATSTGMPEIGKVVGQKTSGLFTKRGLSNVGIGAGVGYASDVTQGLQGMRGEDRTGGRAFIPGAGTVLGTTIPTITEGTQTIKNLRNPELKAERLIAKRKSGLEKLDKYQTVKKATEKGKERGIDIKKILSETDVLAGAVDNTGTITTKGEGGAVEQYTRQFIDGNENIVSDLLKKENRLISPDLVKARLIQQVKKAGIEGRNLTNALKSIDDEIAGYMLRADEQGNIPVSIIHDAKIDKYNGINFFTEGATKKYDKTIARALKEIVEESTTSVDIKNINKELSKHFAVIDYLNRLDNKKVDGGKLGKYFAQTVGAIVGSNFGPLGSIVGAEAGGAIKGGLMSRAFNGKTGKIPQQSEVITEALRVKNEPALRLPQSKSNNLGSRQINQAPTITPTKNVISNNIPQETYLEQGKRELRQIKDVITKDQKGFIAIPGKKQSTDNLSKPALPVYKGEKDLTTKILKDLEGKTTVSKQYILDATNRGELKQVERDLIRDILERETPKVLTKDEMIKRGADGHLNRAVEIEIPLSKIDGKEPTPAMEGGYKKGTPITQPIEVKYEPATDKYMLYAGNHRVTQAEINGQKTIKAFVENAPKSDTINVSDFAKKVKAELLPLKRSFPSAQEGGLNQYARYENITLPQDLRGNVKNYNEVIYQSPIETSAGSVHFGREKNYFGHTRIEDMADNKTRRVIEVQSDLYQKGNLEREFDSVKDIQKQADPHFEINGSKITENTELKVGQFIKDPNQKYNQWKIKSLDYDSDPNYVIGKIEKYDTEAKPRLIKYSEIDGAVIAKKKPSIDKIMTQAERRNLEVKKLQQYNDPTAHFRMIREEIKKASLDGKTKLQFPTGETAMKIEGLGQAPHNWDFYEPDGDGFRVWDARRNFDKLKVGKEITNSTTQTDWIITDVLGDGKFKAVRKKDFSDEAIKNIQNGGFPTARVNQLAETFDISGKVDTNNPIYKFYEKDMGKYLTSKYKAKLVTDKQGVTWYEVDINPEWAKQGVEAFGKISSGALFPIAGASAAGVLGASYIKSKKEKK